MSRIAERLIKAIVREEGIVALAVGLNNAFYHGRVLEKANLEFDQEDLTEIYRALEILGQVAKRIEARN